MVCWSQNVSASHPQNRVKPSADKHIPKHTQTKPYNKPNAIMLSPSLTVSLSLLSAQTPALSSSLSPEVLSLCQSWTALIIMGCETSLTAALLRVPSLCECEPVLTFAVGRRSGEMLERTTSWERGLSHPLFLHACVGVFIFLPKLH